MKLKSILAAFAVFVAVFALTAITAFAAEPTDLLKLTTQLTENMVIDGDCVMAEGNSGIDLNGYKLTINGDLHQTSGVLTLNGGKLDIKGSYSADGGELQFTSDYDKLCIGGSWIIGDCSIVNSNYRTPTVELKGHLQDVSGRDRTDYIGVMRFIGNDTQVVSKTKSGVFGIGGVESTNPKLRFDANTMVSFGVNGNLVINSDVNAGEIYVSQGHLTVNGDVTASSLSAGEDYGNSGSIDIAGSFALADNSFDRYGIYCCNDSSIHINGNCDLYEPTSSGSKVNILNSGTIDVDGTVVYDNLSAAGDNSGDYSLLDSGVMFVGGDLIDRYYSSESTCSTFDGCSFVMDGSSTQRIMVYEFKGSYYPLKLTKDIDNYIFCREDWGNIGNIALFVPLTLSEHLVADIPESVVLGNDRPAMTLTIGGEEWSTSLFDVAYNGFDTAGTAEIVINSRSAENPVVGKVIEKVEVIGANPIPDVQISGDTAYLEWEPVKGAVGYDVHIGSYINEYVPDTSYDFYASEGAYTVYIYPCAADGNTYFGDECLTFTVGGAENVLSQPENVSAQTDGSEILLTWDAVDGAEKYIVDRHDGSGWTTLATVTSAQYKDISVAADKIYIYTVTAVASDGEEAESEPAAVILNEDEELPGIAAPDNVDVSFEGDHNWVMWDSVDGATAYKVIRYDGYEWQSVATVTNTLYDDYEIRGGVTYTYAVYALAGIQTSAPSELVTVETEDSGTAETPDISDDPEFPVGVSVFFDDEGVLWWKDVEGAWGYDVRVSDGVNSIEDYCYDNNSRNYDRYMRNTSFETGTYTIRVYALFTYSEELAYTIEYYFVADGEDTSEVTDEPATDEPATEEPSTEEPEYDTICELEATAGVGEVSLTWNKVKGATNYRVFSYLNGKYTVLGETTDTSYTATGLTVGTEYGFLVRAYVDGAWTAFTKDDNVYATPEAATRPIVTVTPYEGSAQLSWTEVADATSYRVFSYLNGSYKQITVTSDTSCTATGLTSGTEYGFLVRACVGGTWTAFSNADLVYAVIG